MAYHPQEMTNMCIYGKALDYFKAEVSWLKYLMSPPEDFDTIAPADQVKEVDSEGENDMLPIFHLRWGHLIFGKFKYLYPNGELPFKVAGVV